MQSIDFTGGLETEERWQELTHCAILSVWWVSLPCEIHTLGRRTDIAVGEC